MNDIVHKYIDADDFRRQMYEEVFEKDSDMQRWDSGCWIRYKLFENVLDKQPAVKMRPVEEAEWVDDGCLTICSNCKEPRRFPHWTFCPNCGCHMKGDGNE